MTVREQEGRVSNDTWSTVQDASGKIADVQGYALLQLKTIAEKMEGKSKIGGLAKTVEDAKREVQEWLAILTRYSPTLQQAWGGRRDRPREEVPGPQSSCPDEGRGRVPALSGLPTCW